MRLVVACVLAAGMFSATGHAQEVIRGASTDSKTAPKPAVRQVSTQNQASTKNKQATQQKQPITPQTLRGSRYGGFAPSNPAPAEPPALDTLSPRSLTLVNFNTKEQLTVTYWSHGAYHRYSLDQLNRFLRDSQNNTQTEMDPLLFDVLWHTMNIVGYTGPVEVFSAYRSPATNAWLASQSRGVARDSQHMNGNAMDIRFPGVAVFKIRQAARSLQMGGVGFYPRSGFVHLDTGPVRYW